MTGIPATSDESESREWSVSNRTLVVSADTKRVLDASPRPRRCKVMIWPLNELRRQRSTHSTTSSMAWSPAASWGRSRQCHLPSPGPMKQRRSGNGAAGWGGGPVRRGGIGTITSQALAATRLRPPRRYAVACIQRESRAQDLRRYRVGEVVGLWLVDVAGDSWHAYGRIYVLDPTGFSGVLAQRTAPVAASRLVAAALAARSATRSRSKARVAVYDERVNGALPVARQAGFVGRSDLYEPVGQAVAAVGNRPGVCEHCSRNPRHTDAGLLGSGER